MFPLSQFLDCQSQTYFNPLPLVSSSVFSLQIPKRSLSHPRLCSPYFFRFPLSPIFILQAVASESMSFLRRRLCNVFLPGMLHSKCKGPHAKLTNEGLFNAALEFYRNRFNKYVLEDYHYHNCHTLPALRFQLPQLCRVPVHPDPLMLTKLSLHTQQNEIENDRNLAA